MKVNDNPCNFTATYKAKVTLSRQEWLDKTNEIISAVLMQVAGGSPLKTYDTKEDLDLAEPPSEAPENGYEGTRLVKTDEDGKAHWYYFKNDLKQWLDGGIYIAANLEDYCRTNGFYALLGAGYAAQLLSPNGNVISKDTFISRETYNGSSFGEGATVLRKIEGNTEKSINKLIINDMNYDYYGIKLDVKNNIITVDGTADSSVNINISKTLNMPSGTYTFGLNFEGEAVNPSGTYIFIIRLIEKISKESYDIVVTGKDINTKKFITFTSKNPIDTIALYNSKANNSYKKLVIKPMLIEGTLSDLPPYQEPYEGLRSAKPTKLVSTGENLWKGEKAINIKVNEIGSGTMKWGNKIDLAKGTYTISFTYDAENPTQGAIRLTILKNGVYSEPISLYLLSPYVLELNENSTIILWCDYDHYFNSYDDIMINYGTEPKPYEPYTENILEIAPEIQAIEGYGLGAGTARNEVDLVNNKFIRRVVKVKLSEVGINWRKQKNHWFLNMDLPNCKLTIGEYDIPNMLCAEYKTVIYNDLYAQKENMIISRKPSRPAVFIYDASVTTEEQAVIKFGNIELIYELETPEIIELPVEQDNKFVAYMHGTETWEGTQVPVPTEIGYLPDLINKLWDLLTAAQQKAIDDKQDNRIKALEDKSLVEINASQIIDEPDIEISPSTSIKINDGLYIFYNDTLKFSVDVNIYFDFSSPIDKNRILYHNFVYEEDGIIKMGYAKTEMIYDLSNPFLFEFKFESNVAGKLKPIKYFGRTIGEGGVK